MAHPLLLGPLMSTIDIRKIQFKLGASLLVASFALTGCSEAVEDEDQTSESALRESYLTKFNACQRGVATAGLDEQGGRTLRTATACLVRINGDISSAVTRRAKRNAPTSGAAGESFAAFRSAYAPFCITWGDAAAKDLCLYKVERIISQVLLSHGEYDAQIMTTWYGQFACQIPFDAAYARSGANFSALEVERQECFTKQSIQAVRRAPDLRSSEVSQLELLIDQANGAGYGLCAVVVSSTAGGASQSDMKKMACFADVTASLNERVRFAFGMPTDDR